MYNTVDLFSGAGGLSYGFEKTGMFKIVAAAETNKNARKTYINSHKNKKDIMMIDDVRGYNFKELSKKVGEISVVIGGPPCQGFSNANRQKNNVVNSNNKLVKEFFRAIKEIKPLAFVMENVNTLSSDTHRFYDSHQDSKIIKDLGIRLRDDTIIISTGKYQGIELEEEIRHDRWQKWKISKQLFHLLNVLYKNRNNSDRLSKYIDKSAITIINEIGKQDEEVKQRLPLWDTLILIRNNIKDKQEFENYKPKLKELITLQKSINILEELTENEIIYNLGVDDITGGVYANVKSYSVLDYIDAILGDEYAQKGDVINSLWFGVPQERKRYIILGIKKEVLGEKEVCLPTEPAYYEKITVGEAILDLQEYKTFTEATEDAKLPINKHQTNLSNYAKSMRTSEYVYNHIIPLSTETALERFTSLKEGENFHKLKDNMKKSYANPGRTQNSIYLRLNSSEPSGTVINVRKSMWIHPKLDRAISVREAARLQSFPDDFVFYGTKDSQYQQVGNAVPPLMAEKISECLLKQLNI